MSVEVTDSSHVALYCNTTDQAFGPVFSSEEEAQLFEEWYTKVFPIDIRAEWFGGAHATVMERYRNWHRVTHHLETGEFNPSIAESIIRSGVRT